MKKKKSITIEEFIRKQCVKECALSEECYYLVDRTNVQRCFLCLFHNKEKKAFEQGWEAALEAHEDDFDGG